MVTFRNKIPNAGAHPVEQSHKKRQDVSSDQGVVGILCDHCEGYQSGNNYRARLGQNDSTYLVNEQLLYL